MLTRPGVRASVAFLAASAVIAIWTLVRVFNPAAPEPIHAVPFDASTAISAVTPKTPADLGLAVENDLFAVDRSAPDRPYRLPGEEDAEPAEPKVEPPIPIVLGTAYIGEGYSFATCQLGDAQPVIVRVGDKIGVYTVKSIERGRVVFTSASKRLDIPALKPGA
ncbi:MAG: hypothetical protein V4550_02585 [Gemmatimonadota bacterium]